jgi:hypothetical protein
MPDRRRDMGSNQALLHACGNVPATPANEATTTLLIAGNAASGSTLRNYAEYSWLAPGLDTLFDKSADIPATATINDVAYNRQGTMVVFAISASPYLLCFEWDQINGIGTQLSVSTTTGAYGFIDFNAAGDRLIGNTGARNDIRSVTSSGIGVSVGDRNVAYSAQALFEPSSSGYVLLLGTRNAELWTFTGTTLGSKLSVTLPTQVTAGAWRPDGSGFALCGGHGNVYGFTFNKTTGVVGPQMTPTPALSSSPVELCFSPGGEALFIAQESMTAATAVIGIGWNGEDLDDRFTTTGDTITNGTTMMDISASGNTELATVIASELDQLSTWEYDLDAKTITRYGSAVTVTNSITTIVRFPPTRVVASPPA